MPSMQETFDIMVKHMRKQGPAFTDFGTKQFYRCSNGKRCPAGALIPDELYETSMEGNTVLESRAGEVIVKQGHSLLIVEPLQRIHDCQEEKTWESSFKWIARKFKLLYTPPAILEAA